MKIIFFSYLATAAYSTIKYGLPDDRKTRIQHMQKKIHCRKPNNIEHHYTHHCNAILFHIISFLTESLKLVCACTLYNLVIY